ncbi:MAG: leucine-rich repeat domain-containing protein [Lachnospiraceae bacterium]|nr:leucine-rich repeat domain-containing protein [Lachnospiraceae bacterium]
MPMENGIFNIAKETVYAAEDNSLENWTFEDIDNSTVKAVSYTGPEEEVTIPEVVNGKTVTVIGKETFFRSGVKSVILPDTVTTIEDYAFSLSDIESVTISKNVTQIGEYAFSECFKLAEFIVSADSEHYTSENRILYNKDKTSLLFVTNSYENEFTIPETVVNVKKGAFKNCEKNNIYKYSQRFRKCRCRGIKY